MDVASTSPTGSMPIVPDVLTHELIDQLGAAVNRQRPDKIRALIIAIQNRCLAPPGSVHPHINPLVRIFLNLSVYPERAEEQYHLAQLLAMISYRSSVDQPSFFLRIPDKEWAQLKGMLGRDPLLDLPLYCFWGNYWRLCYPQDKLNWKEYLRMAIKTAKAVKSAAEIDLGPAIEFGNELTAKTKEIPPDWVHWGSVAIAWGRDPSRYQALLHQIDKHLAKRRKIDSASFVAEAHALALVIQRRGQNAISAFDRLRMIACVGKHDKPSTNRFWEARLHAWSLLLSLGPEWASQDLLQQQLSIEKNQQVRALLRRGNAPYNCCHLAAPSTTFSAEIEEDLVEETKAFRRELLALLVEHQGQMTTRLADIIANQRIMIAHQRATVRGLKKLSREVRMIRRMGARSLFRIARRQQRLLRNTARNSGRIACLSAALDSRLHFRNRPVPPHIGTEGWSHLQKRRMEGRVNRERPLHEVFHSWPKADTSEINQVFKKRVDYFAVRTTIFKPSAPLSYDPSIDYEKIREVLITKEYYYQPLLLHLLPKRGGPDVITWAFSPVFHLLGTGHYPTSWQLHIIKMGVRHLPLIVPGILATMELAALSRHLFSRWQGAPCRCHECSSRRHTALHTELPPDVRSVLEPALRSKNLITKPELPKRIFRLRRNSPDNGIACYARLSN